MEVHLQKVAKGCILIGSWAVDNLQYAPISQYDGTQWSHSTVELKKLFPPVKKTFYTHYEYYIRYGVAVRVKRNRSDNIVI
jgi:hypothetical protein